MIRFFKQIAYRKYNQDWIDSWNKIFFFFSQLDFCPQRPEEIRGSLSVALLVLLGQCSLCSLICS